MQLPSSRARAQQLWHTGLVAPQHGRSSGTRDQTPVSCIGRQISLPLNHQGSLKNKMLMTINKGNKQTNRDVLVENIDKMKLKMPLASLID